jgi:hypothetical protein
MMSAHMALKDNRCYDLIEAVGKRLPLRNGAIILQMLEKHEDAPMGSSEVNDLIALCIICLDEEYEMEEE